MTYSIVAFCTRTRRIGVAVATKALAVGGLVLERRYGAGVCVTQAFTSPLYRLWTLDAMAAGASPGAAIAAAQARDPRADLRQVLVCAEDGRLAVHTGARVDGAAGQIARDDFAVAGNMLASVAVVEAVAATFAAATRDDMPRRLLAAMSAGLAAGGDKRGQQSACLALYGAEPYPELDLRVDDGPEPLTELARLLMLHESMAAPIRAGLPTLADPTGKRGL